MAVVLDVERISFGHRGRPRLMEDVSFGVAEGDVLCLLGANGAGKTTLLRCLLGIHAVTAGRITLGGRPLERLSRRAIAATVAYVPQSSAASLPMRALDMVLMGRTPHIAATAVASGHDEAVAHDALDRLGILHLRDRPFDEMSGGERQLVLVARAICQEARLLIMDEPTAHLDYGNQVRILQIVSQLQARGYAIVMTAHNPDHALLAATHVAVLADGRLSAPGHPDDVVTSERLTALYGIPMRVIASARDDVRDGALRACVPLMESGAGGPRRPAASANAPTVAGEETRRTPAAR